jgi:16S rRNA (cytosine967-C5)-methyltransferase
LETLCQSFNQPATTIVRLNRLRTEQDADAADPLLMAGATPLEKAPDFFQCSDLPLGWLRAGLVYAQDPATMLAPTKLAPQPGDRVLDACAAPGGKAAVLAQLMNNQGHLLCTDPSPARLERLQSNLDRLGVTCAKVRKLDWARPAPRLEPFDRILLDVPCSNSGVLRRRVDARWRLSVKGMLELIDLQRSILTHVWPCLKPGGRLVYSTCSLEIAENEDQSAWATTHLPGARLVEQSTQWPHRTGWDGAFVAVLEKSTEV